MTDFAHRDPAARMGRFAKGSPDPGDVYVVPGLNTMSVAFMLQPGAMIANRLVPSVPVTIQSAKYASYPRGYFFRDEMGKRADGAESAGGGFAIDWSNAYNADVFAFHTDLGPQARANAQMVDLDRSGTMLCTNKALIKREVLALSSFFKTGVWTTQIQGKLSGGGGLADVDLTWTDAAAKPIKQIKAAIRKQQVAASGYKPNKATFSPDLWDIFTEHPNVINRVNAGQTPGAPAEVTTQMAAAWLGLKEVYVAESVKTTSAENTSTTGAGDAFNYIAPAGQLMLTYTPDAPGLLEPSAFYFFDWVADGLVGSFGNAVSRWYIQERKSMRYEIEMATDPHVVSADCGTLMFNFNA
jgi:hypothetical protein